MFHVAINKCQPKKFGYPAWALGKTCLRVPRAHFKNSTWVAPKRHIRDNPCANSIIYVCVSIALLWLSYINKSARQLLGMPISFLSMSNIYLELCFLKVRYGKRTQLTVHVLIVMRKIFIEHIYYLKLFRLKPREIGILKVGKISFKT